MGKKEDILAATLDLVVEEGLASFSFSKLLERAGVGSGTVYNYFPGKEALLSALFETVSGRFDDAVRTTWSGERSTRAQFEALMRGLARYTMERPADVAFVEACSRAPEIPRALRERTMPSQALLMRVISAAQAEGLLRPMEPHLAMAIASSLVVSTTAAGVAGKYRFGERELEVVVESSWRALATGKGLKRKK